MKFPYINKDKVFIGKFVFQNMAEGKLSVPSGFGGLMRFDQEYSSIFNLKPSHVILFLIMILAFRVFLGVFM